MENGLYILVFGFKKFYLHFYQMLIDF